MEKQLIKENDILPNLCFGTDITSLHSWGIKRKFEEMKYWVKILLNKNKKISEKSLKLPKIIETCMKNGCNMFDTSRAYDSSEYTLGKVLKKYPRESYYVVTKLCNTAQYENKVRESFIQSLNELDMEYVDVYLMHWPVKEHFVESWKTMEKLYEEGLCKSIGVCNFNIHHFEELKKHAKIMPMFNQIECHPLFTQTDLRKYCNDNNIKIMAYTSTARMDERLNKTVLVPIAKKYNKSIAQVILKWHQQIGNIPIVNTFNKKHMIENINIKDFYLTNQEIESINRININSRLRYDPDNCDFKQL